MRTRSVAAAEAIADSAWQELVEEWTLRGSSEACDVWDGAINSDGYGYVSIDGRSYLAHRLTYALRFGYAPEGMVLDHLCANRWCVKPEHLEPVTIAENFRRGGRPHFEAVS